MTTRCFLSNGLCVLNAKQKTKELIQLSLTDFDTTGKFMFDTIEKKIVRATTDLKLNASDNDLICSFIKSKEQVTPAKKDTATSIVAEA
jgi:hypothetical protein